MNGIIAALTGVVARDGALDVMPHGGVVANLDLVVRDLKRPSDVAPQWVRAALFAEQAERAQRLGLLVKGSGLYLEGRLELKTWTGRDGQDKTGMHLWAWRADRLDGIGFLPQLNEVRARAEAAWATIPSWRP